MARKERTAHDNWASLSTNYDKQLFFSHHCSASAIRLAYTQGLYEHTQWKIKTIWLCLDSNHYLFQILYLQIAKDREGIEPMNSLQLLHVQCNFFIHLSTQEFNSNLTKSLTSVSTILGRKSLEIQVWFDSAVPIAELYLADLHPIHTNLH